MVLSNTKLKKKKREVAAAIAALAPPPDSNATPSSADVVMGDSPAVVSAKKKRPKAKKANGNGENGTVVDVPADGDNGIANATPEVSLEGSAPQDEGGKPKKKRKNTPEVEVSEDTPKGAERAGEKFPSSDGRDAGVSEVNGEGAVPESNPEQGEDVSKIKMRKKPRWEVDENGKRIRPKKVAGEDEGPSEGLKASTSSDKDTEKGDATNGDVAAAAPASDGDRIHQGDEPWLQSKRSKKKKKLLDKWGKRIDNAAVADEQPANEEVPQNGSSTEKVDPKKVMVGGMPYYITEDDIHEFFKECGTIAELDCMTFADTGKFKGIAFITFRTEEAAKRALALDGADMGGRFLKIEICKIKPRESAKKDVYQEPPKKYEGCLSAYIGNLSWDITEKELRKFFKGCKIDAIRFAMNKETEEFRGFGHVDFADDESLEAAMKLDQMPVLDRPLKIAYSVPPKNKPVDVNPGQLGAKKKGCFTCGEEGHMSYNCPKKDVSQ